MTRPDPLPAFDLGRFHTKPLAGRGHLVETGRFARPIPPTASAADFVSSHADRLRTLDGFEHAANQLARTRGTIAYLRLRGEPVLDVGELTHARLGVLAFLSSVWSDAVVN